MSKEKVLKLCPDAKLVLTSRVQRTTGWYTMQDAKITRDDGAILVSSFVIEPPSPQEIDRLMEGGA